MGRHEPAGQAETILEPGRGKPRNRTAGFEGEAVNCFQPLMFAGRKLCYAAMKSLQPPA